MNRPLSLKGIILFCYGNESIFINVERRIIKDLLERFLELFELQPRSPIKKLDSRH